MSDFIFLLQCVASNTSCRFIYYKEYLPLVCWYFAFIFDFVACWFPYKFISLIEAGVYSKACRQRKSPPITLILPTVPKCVHMHIHVYCLSVNMADCFPDNNCYTCNYSSKIFSLVYDFWLWVFLIYCLLQSPWFKKASYWEEPWQQDFRKQQYNQSVSNWKY